MTEAARSAEKTREILTTARKRHDIATTAEADNRRDALDDLRFQNGEHWDPKDRKEREDEGRPCITVNKFPTLIHQVTNDQRQNRPTINISPVGSGSDVKVAQITRDMIRAIQRNSDADIAIDTAFQGAAGPGWGYWRIATEYESADSFDQVLVWRRIRNAFTVYCDPSAQDPTTADKSWCLVEELVPIDDFKAKYPHADPVDFETTSAPKELAEWYDEKHVRVAEYWVVEIEMAELVALANGFVGFRADLAPAIEAQVAADLALPAAQRTFLKRTRKAERKTVRCYTITGRQIIDEYEWLDEIIPIVRVIGDELDIEGKVTLSGITRHGKGPAFMYDYASSAEIERVGMSPKSPFVAAFGQVTGRKGWKDANRKNIAVLEYNPIDVNGNVLPPPQRQAPISADAGILALKEAAAQDLLGTTGIRFSADKHERSYDESGVALQQLRQNTDLGAYHYHDNLARALKVTGGIFVRMIPKIYDTPRIVTIVREDGTDDHVLLDVYQNQALTEVEYGDDKKKYRSFNPAIGKYAVAVTIGPNFATRRREQSLGMMEFMKVDPTATQLISDLVAKVQDWEGADEISRRLALRLPPGTIQPESKDLSPQAQALLTQMQQQIQQLMQERQQLLMALNEKQTEHAIAAQKNEIAAQKNANDFEAKMTQIVADLIEAKMDRATEAFLQAAQAAQTVQAPATKQ